MYLSISFFFVKKKKPPRIVLHHCFVEKAYLLLSVQTVNVSALVLGARRSLFIQSLRTGFTCRIFPFRQVTQLACGLSKHTSVSANVP